jgi:hypothetical protein
MQTQTQTQAQGRTQTTETDRGRGAGGSASSRGLTLDDLAAMDVGALGALFAAGTVPASVSALDGHPRGRMLAVKHLDRGAIFGALRGLAGGRAFPWGGKSFASAGPGATEGTGVNRVHLGGRHNLFPFHTRLEPSRVDGQPALVLDYDLPDNPGFIRAIHDEVRLCGEGLWLGPAMWKTRAEPVFVLWFALDTRVQATPIGGGR